MTDPTEPFLTFIVFGLAPTSPFYSFQKFRKPVSYLDDDVIVSSSSRVTPSFLPVHTLASVFWHALFLLGPRAEQTCPSAEIMFRRNVSIWNFLLAGWTGLQWGGPLYALRWIHQLTVGNQCTRKKVFSLKWKVFGWRTGLRNVKTAESLLSCILLCSK
jgi:hypothetical protein